MYIRYISQTLLYHFTASRDKNSASMKPDCTGQVSSPQPPLSPAPPPPTSPHRDTCSPLCAQYRAAYVTLSTRSRSGQQPRRGSCVHFLVKTPEPRAPPLTPGLPRATMLPAVPWTNGPNVCLMRHSVSWQSRNFISYQSSTQC